MIRRRDLPAGAKRGRHTWYSKHGPVPIDDGPGGIRFDPWAIAFALWIGWWIFNVGR